MRALAPPPLVLVLLLATVGPGRLDAQSWRTVTTSRQIGEERALDVRVSYGAGQSSVRPASPGTLYRMQLRYDQDLFEPRSKYDGRTLELELEGTPSIRFWKQGGAEMDLELAGSVPMNLDLEFGAVSAELELGGLSLTNLSVKTGASESVLEVSRPNPSTMTRASFQVGAADFTARHLGNLNARRIEVGAGVGDLTIDLTGDWRQDADVDVKMGLGSLQLVFPDGLGVKLDHKTFLTSLDTQGLVKRGDSYYSLDWETAEHRVNVRIEAAFVSVGVSWEG